VQVHKIDLKTVPHAKLERSGVDPDIIGMTGVPDYIVEAKLEGRDIVEAIRFHKKTIQAKMEINSHLTNIGFGSISSNKFGSTMTQQMVSINNASVSTRYGTLLPPFRDFFIANTYQNSGS